MTTDQWAKIKEVLEAVLDHPCEERAAFLDDVCAGNNDLRNEVASLLDAYERADADDALESPFAPTNAPLDAGPSASLEGEQIGPYRLVRELARGGMGTVYLARRDDDQFQQTVALKLIRQGLDSDDLLSRFRYERQILASLDHPHIAHLLDGGMTPDGRPYFVMEYVEGSPVTDYCDRHRLSTKQRLALFRTVSRTVQYAHQMLVVHRDLKPSNILVTDDGTVKLLDFGIAKLLTEEATDHPKTQTGMRLMTPEYASPEQIRGEAITTATDVYQLGVLLYELLTGHRPYRLSERMRYEIERVILEEEPTRPSTAVRRTEEVQQGERTTSITPEDVSTARSTTVEGLHRRLSGDLDMIVLKALKKEPDRRYASVEQLSEDIRRHLVGLPVLARPETVSYRISKFIRRHTVGVAATAAVILSLAGGVVAATTQARRAQAEATKAERINDFLQEMLGSVDPHADGRDVTVAEVLEEAAQQVETELIDQPDIEAAVRRTIGITYQNLALYDEAETHLQHALDLRRTNLGQHHFETTQSLKDFALLKHWQGDFDTAARYYREAIDLFRKNGKTGIGLAEALNDYGTLLMDQGLYDESEAHFRDALAITRSLYGNEHVMVASNLTNIALARHWQEDVEAADSLYRQALAIQYNVVGPEHIEVAYTLNNLAWVYLDKDDPAGADSLFRASLAIRRKQLGNTHPSVALALHNLASLVHYPEGHYADADTLLREALAICRQAIPGAHLYTANTLSSLAMVRVAQEHLPEAETLYREALAMRTHLLGETNPLAAGTAVDLGGVLYEQKRYDEAEPLLQSGLTRLEAAGHEKARDALQRLVDLYEAWGKPEQANTYRAALAEIEEAQ
ncbi:MAG: tetratricopeptide repeat protein [Rhodothermales bacterium]